MNKEEYEGLKRYLKLEILEKCQVINEQEQDEIKYLTKFDSVRELVDAHKKLEEGFMTQDEFDELHDKYRFMAAHPEDEGFDDEDLDLISHEIPIYSDGIISRDALDEMVNKLDDKEEITLDREYQELAEYFRYDVLRDENPDEELEEKIESLSMNNEMVEKLERARILLQEGKISKESYRALLSFYKSELEDAINNS